MALIKCKECGHEVSDKASMCPNCGCPIGSVGVTKEEVLDEEPKKKKGWIKALIVAALFCLLGGGYYAYTHFFKANNKEEIVELTPEFIKSLEVYDELAPFSNGYAAVRRGKKWGYINTKGEEVIPCSFDYAGIFSEGLAAVYQNGKAGYINTKGEEAISCSYDNIGTFSEGLAAVSKNSKWGWINKKGEIVIPISIEAKDVGQFSEGLVFLSQGDGEKFSFMNVSGKIVFGGKWDGFFDAYLYVPQECFPRFHEGFAYVPTGYEKERVYTRFDKQGNKGGTISESELPEFVSYESEDDEDYEDLYGRYSYKGLRGKDGKVIFSPKYDEVGGTYGNIIQISNGVVVVKIDEFDVFGSYATSHYGYADLKGNDTFSNDLKEKCRDSKENALRQEEERHEKEYEEYDIQSESVSAFDDTASEDYEVRKWLEGQWVRAEIDPTMIELVYYVYTFYPDGYNFSYGSEHTYNQSRDRLPYTVNGDVICSAGGSPMLRIDRGRNALVDCDKPEEIYKKR